MHLRAVFCASLREQLKLMCGTTRSAGRLIRRGASVCAVLLLLMSGAAPVRAGEREAAREFARAARDEPSLIAFLRQMPKGGDLHNHAGGALWAEDSLREAIRSRLFYNPATFSFEETASTLDSVPAAQLLQDDALRYAYLNAASVRGGVGRSAEGHDHFFKAFGPANSGFATVSDEEQLAGIVRRARLQNLQYVELMAWPGGQFRRPLDDIVRPEDTPEQLWIKLQPLLPAFVRDVRRTLDRWDRNIGTGAGLSGPVSDPAGALTVRFLASASRVRSPEYAFVTWAAAFAVMREDPRLVGVNLVAPEDHPLAVQYFDRNMRDLDFLWQRMGNPNVTLHAGELNLLLSPIEHLTHHIRASIQLGHARRIGHGTAVAWEDEPHQLLTRMRREGIAVEVCPTSAAVILGAEGKQHPFRLYRRFGVPLTINTDDEAVNRTSLTLEFMRAVRSWKLTYREVKELIRNSLEYSFLPGPSLFENHDYRKLAPAFRTLVERRWEPDAAQQEVLARSARAAVQRRLEQELQRFETRVGKIGS